MKIFNDCIYPSCLIFEKGPYIPYLWNKASIAYSSQPERGFVKVFAFFFYLIQVFRKASVTKQTCLNQRFLAWCCKPRPVASLDKSMLALEFTFGVSTSTLAVSRIIGSFFFFLLIVPQWWKFLCALRMFLVNQFLSKTFQPLKWSGRVNETLWIFIHLVWLLFLGNKTVIYLFIFFSVCFIYIFLKTVFPSR